MGLIAQLCNKALLLEKGQIKYNGKVDEAIMTYNRREKHNLIYKNESSAKDIFLQKIELKNPAGQPTDQFMHNESIIIQITACCKIPPAGVEFGIVLLNNYQQRLFTIHESLSKAKRTGDLYEITIQLQSGLIVPNNYQFYFDLFTPYQAIFDSVSGYFPVKISDAGSIYAGFEGGEYGYFFINHEIIN
jgi:hypothetical protein